MARTRQMTVFQIPSSSSSSSLQCPLLRAWSYDLPRKPQLRPLSQANRLPGEQGGLQLGASPSSIPNLGGPEARESEREREREREGDEECPTWLERVSVEAARGCAGAPWRSSRSSWLQILNTISQSTQKVYWRHRCMMEFARAHSQPPTASVSHTPVCMLNSLQATALAPCPAALSPEPQRDSDAGPARAGILDFAVESRPTPSLLSSPDPGPSSAHFDGLQPQRLPLHLALRTHCPRLASPGPSDQLSLMGRSPR
eukprot:3419701-Rhodomonas_salina.2